MKRKTHPTTGRDRPAGLLSSPLWSKLPMELLTEIVTQTTDMETLDSWCEASQGSQILHEIAMAARWRTVTIDDQDLLPAPGQDKTRFNWIRKNMWKQGVELCWTPAYKLVNMLLDPIKNKPGRCPANYVQDLVFDFRLLIYLEEDVQDSNFYVQDLMPTVEALKHTLEKLKGHFPNLRSLRCYGDAPQGDIGFHCEPNCGQNSGFRDAQP